MRTRVKICGMTDPADAAMAARAGADAVGVVFYPKARRCVTVDRAREIVRAVGPYVTVVALFVDQAPREIVATCEAAGISSVQLHGHEPVDMLADLARFTIIKAVKVVKVVPGEFEAEVARWKDAATRFPHLKALLMETNAKAPGGTGIENDWALIRAARDRGIFDNGPAVVAAGGITPENVRRVVEDVRPWAVDLSSGVEGAVYGRKDESKVRGIIEAVHAADAGLLKGKSDES